MTTDRIGQQLGNYTITRLLGQGGFADVYLGEHIYLKSQAAVKVLQARLSGADDMDSFLKEAQTIARLFHPHIIRIMDFGVAAETPYLVMDYAPKGTLRQKHPRGTPVPLTTVVSYVKQIADALQYAHDELRLIHRDIKPENMLVGRRDEIVLSDFGIALVAQSSRYQGSQDVIGTVAYMAPEQIQGKPRAASDQYSLAVVVYEWLTGDRPFHGSFTEMCTQHIFAPPPPLREKAPSLPRHIDLVVMQALAKDPQQRFENIQAFANALEQVSQSQGERTEQMSPTFHSLLTQMQTNNSVDAAYPPTLLPSPPTTTPSLPLQSGTSGQPFTLPAQSGRSTQPPQQQVVLPAQPIYNPQYPGGGNIPQHPSQFAPQTPSYRPGEAQRAQQTQYPPRPNNTQQAQQFSPSYSSRTPQQSARSEAPQAMAPQRPTADARYNAPPVHSGAATQPTDEGTNEGLGMLAPLARPLIATIAGIALFCIAIVFHPYLLGRPIFFTIAIPLIFGVAFGPIVGLLVGLGGVFCLNLIGLPPFISFYTDYTFLGEHFISLHATRYWWHPLLINGLVGFMAGFSMLRTRRFPTIGSTIRGTILGAIGLFGSVGFVLYSQFGLSAFSRSLINIGLLSIVNVLVAFALLVIYSVLGRLLDPGV